MTDYVAYAMTQINAGYRRAEEFDLIHNHIDYFAFPLADISPTPTLHHPRPPRPARGPPRLRGVRGVATVAITSHDQRTYLLDTNWVAIVYNVVDLDHFRFRSDPGDYLIFLGHISPEKRVDRAIELARDVGMRLLIAAKVTPSIRVLHPRDRALSRAHRR